jgi:RNA polymerase sigma factor (sigma-70 family)
MTTPIDSCHREPTDAELLGAVRAGDPAAFGELYRRHEGAARRLAGSLAPARADAEDLVAETFAKVLAALLAGRGPDLSARGYLFTTLRHVWYDRSRRDARVELTDDLTRYETGTAPPDTTGADLERDRAAEAFATLPERWRTVLWHTAVEGGTPAQVAPLLGLTPGGVAALAFRARERLRQRYLEQGD